jgi:hypothetical protein
MQPRNQVSQPTPPASTSTSSPTSRPKSSVKASKPKSLSKPESRKGGGFGGWNGIREVVYDLSRFRFVQGLRGGEGALPGWWRGLAILGY